MEVHMDDKSGDATTFTSTFHEMCGNGSDPNNRGILSANSGMIDLDDDPKVGAHSNWVEGAIIFGIIMEFLLEINIPGLTPLLLFAVVIQLDRASFVADTLQTYTSTFSTDPAFDFVPESWFEDVFEYTRNDSYQSLEDVTLDLIRMVSVRSIEAVLSLSASYASYLYQIGFSNIPFESSLDDHSIPLDAVNCGFQCNKDQSNIGLAVPVELTAPSMPLVIHPTVIGVSSGTLLDINSTSHCQGTSTSASANLLPSALPARNHRCAHCDKGFPTSSNRRRHEKSVHSGTIACRHCEKPLRDRAGYKKKDAKLCKALPREDF
ncbi:hypothetical protein BDD12DRAFT_803233 [Trichophaea hybrida]|nr:hypothetical protein BDD12DRAFT_803233 [Trichophaea hybrida]